MKKITFLIGLVVLVSTITVEANITNKPNGKFGNYGRYHQRPVTFTERNVKFYIYQNGDLDFDLNPYRNDYYGSSDYYYKGNRKQKARTKHQSNRQYGHHSGYIKYDYYGRVKRIGSIFIRYDYHGRVISINGIRMAYRYYGLSRVGNLRVVLDRYGRIRFIGRVKPKHYHYHSYYNDYYYDDYIYDFDDDFFYDDDFEDTYEYFDEDDDFYYYRSKNKHSKTGRNGKKESKQKMIKRKKAKNKKKRHS